MGHPRLLTHNGPPVFDQALDNLGFPARSGVGSPVLKLRTKPWEPIAEGPLRHHWKSREIAPFATFSGERLW
jgi:hypothetical protein